MQTRYGLTKTGLLLVSLLLLNGISGFARDKYETIDATAWGTSTQMGKNIGITIIIYEYSTPADQDLLTEAFQKGQSQGLVNALEKMKAVGHVSITGTLGYDLSFIKLIQTPTGRTIRFATNRPIRFGAYSENSIIATMPSWRLCRANHRRHRNRRRRPQVVERSSCLCSDLGTTFCSA